MKVREQNITQAATVLLMSTVLVKLIGALFKIPLSADYALGDLGFGYFSVAYDLYAPIYILALSGFPVAISRMVAQYTAKQRFQDADRVFCVSMKAMLVLGGMGTVIMLLLSLPLVALTDKSGQSIYSLWAIAPSVFFCAVISVYRGYFEGLKNMLPTAVSSVIEALGKLVLGLSAAIITVRSTKNSAYAAAAAMMGITIGTAISCIYLAVIHKKRNLVDIRGSEIATKQLLGDLVRFTLPVAIASLAVSFTSLIDSFTLRSTLGLIISNNIENATVLLKDTLYTTYTIEEIPTIIYGIKGKAHTLFNLVPSLTTALGVGALPLVTQYFVKGDKPLLKKNINLIIKFASIISFPVAAGFIAVGKNIMDMFYGDVSSVLGGKILALYGIAALFAGLSVPVTALLQSVEKQNQALLNIGIGIFIKLICNVFLARITVINIYGAVIGTTLCFAVIFALHIITLVKTVEFIPSIIDVFLKPFFAAFCCGIMAHFVVNTIKSSVNVVISIVVSAVVYMTILLISKAIKKNEVDEIFKK